MDLQSFLLILIVALDLSLGIIVLIKNFKSFLSKIFFFCTFFLSIWVLSTYYESEFLSDSSLTYLLVKTDFASAVLLAYFLFLFCLQLPKQTKPFTIKKHIYILFPAIIFFIVSYTGLIVKNIELLPEGINVNSGILYLPYAIYLGFYILGGPIYLIYAIRKYKGIQKIQIKYVLIGLLLSAVIALLTNLVIPRLFTSNLTIEFIPRLGLYGIVIFLSFTAYSITRYRLMDIRIVIKSTLTYFFSVIVLLFVLVFIYYLCRFFKVVIDFNDFLIAGTTIIIFPIIYNPLKSFCEKSIKRYLFKTFYTSQQAIQELTKEATTIIELNKLLVAIVNTLKKSMGLNRVGVLLFDPKTNKYQIGQVFGFALENGISLIRNNYLTQILSTTQKIVVLEEIDLLYSQSQNNFERTNLKKLKINMRHIEASICLPLISKEKLLGLIILGEKLSNEAYTKEDLDLLLTLSRQSTIAIENARLYSNMQDIVDEQTKEIRELLKIKSEFLTVASHQLRTPVSIVRGYLSMVDEGSVKGEQREDFIKKAFIGANAMEQVVHDLLTITELEGGKVEIKCQPTDIIPFIKETIAARQIFAKKKNLELTFQEPKKPLPKLMIDNIKINDVIGNLIDNAIHYTFKGKIQVNLTLQDQMAKISVTDTGIGFSLEDKKKFFQKFSRTKEALKANPNGSGMGLYVVKLLVDQMNGEVDCSSPGQGKGATFSVYLPLAG